MRRFRALAERGEPLADTTRQLEALLASDGRIELAWIGEYPREPLQRPTEGPVAMDGYLEISYVIEPDEMEFSFGFRPFGSLTAESA